MPHTPVVLVVEDEDAVRTTLCATLTLTGFTTLQAATVDAALKVLGTERVDAISLDIRLPDETGRQRCGLTLLSFLRATAEYAHLPAIVLTGVTPSPEEEALIKRCDARLFFKPQSYSAMIDYLRSVLRVEG